MEDYPVKEIPDIPHWSENYALAGFDPDAGVGIFFHLGRWRKDPDLWREMVTVLLTDGTVVAHRAIGNANVTKEGPGGPNLRMEILRDGQSQRWSFLGAARHQLVERLRDSLLADGPMERFEFSLTFDSEFPTWNLGASGENSSFAGHGHLEQIGRLTGEIGIGGRKMKFDNFANRDHSRGPRLVGPLVRHHWFQGYLDNGIKFCAYEAEEAMADGGIKKTFSKAALIIDKKMIPAEVSIGFHLPLDCGLDYIRQPVPFKLEWEGGSIKGKITSFPTTMYHQFTAPWDTYLGSRQVGDKPDRRMVEQAVMYQTDDGIPGHGHMERTVPGELLTDELLDSQ